MQPQTPCDMQWEHVTLAACEALLCPCQVKQTQIKACDVRALKSCRGIGMWMLEIAGVSAASTSIVWHAQTAWRTKSRSVFAAYVIRWCGLLRWISDLIGLLSDARADMPMTVQSAAVPIRRARVLTLTVQGVCAAAGPV